jgi:hypothetical protein
MNFVARYSEWVSHFVIVAFFVPVGTIASLSRSEDQPSFCNSLLHLSRSFYLCQVLSVASTIWGLHYWNTEVSSFPRNLYSRTSVSRNLGTYIPRLPFQRERMKKMICAHKVDFARERSRERSPSHTGTPLKRLLTNSILRT